MENQMWYPRYQDQLKYHYRSLKFLGLWKVKKGYTQKNLPYPSQTLLHSHTSTLSQSTLRLSRRANQLYSTIWPPLPSLQVGWDGPIMDTDGSAKLQRVRHEWARLADNHTYWNEEVDSFWGKTAKGYSKNYCRIWFKSLIKCAVESFTKRNYSW